MHSFSARSRQNVNIWPGFVDALASILMVFIFVLLILVVAQFFLSNLLSDRSGALEQLSKNVHYLLDALSVEKDRASELETKVTELNDALTRTSSERDSLLDRLQLATEATESARQETALTRAELERAREEVSAGKERIELKLSEIVSLQEDIDALRKVREDLEDQVGALAEELKARDADLEARSAELSAERDRSKALEARLSDETERTHLAQVEIEESNVNIQGLRARIMSNDKALAEERQLSSAAQAEIELLNNQLAALRDQLAMVQAALEISESTASEYKVEVDRLGQQLNIALARRVEELSRYRSDFFGKLREVLGERQDIRVVGDRFVFQSEVLFPSGSADLEPAGRASLDRLAATLTEVTQAIPAEVDWILRVDGHTDKRPISTDRFPSNWELSTARALSIVRYLIGRGIEPRRLAATGFGEFRPIETGDSPAAL
ncbi:MAG: peptidoglycan -binding protein, partial [Gammaproteobacteria bacterium]